jgi:4-amino-4-deoxy-L-arabinose transferase-like glycosyltransferase
MTTRDKVRPALLASILVLNLLTIGLIVALRVDAGGDEPIYFDVAENLYEGQGFSTDFKYDVRNPRTFPPYPFDRRFFYLYLCSLAFHVNGETSVKICSLLSAVFQSCLAILVFYLGSELFDRRTGLVAAILYAFNPWYKYLGIKIQSDMTATCLYYLCVLLLLYYLRKKGSAQILLCGLLFALTFLTREETILLGPFVVVMMLWYHASKKHLLCFLLPFLIVFLARGWYLYRAFGSFFHEAQPLSVLPSWELFYTLESHTWSTYFKDVGGLGAAIAVRLINYLVFFRNFFSDGIVLDTAAVMGILPLSSLPFIVLAYYREIGPEKKRALIALGLLFLAQLMFTIGYPGYALVSAESRHGQLIAPFLIILASAGLLSVTDKTTILKRVRTVSFRRISLSTLKAVFIINYVLFCFIFTAVHLDRYVLRVSDGAELTKLSKWSREHLPQTAVLMTRKPQWVHYYSDRTAVSAPLASFADMMDYAKRNGVTHVVISHKERSWRPNLLPGILAYPANFRLLHEDEEAGIYEVLSYDFGDEKIKVAEDEGLLSSYTNPLEYLTWEDILRKRHENLSRSLKVWGQLLAEGTRMAQVRWDGVKYSQLNWLYRIVQRPEHRLEADFGKFRLLGYSLDTNALANKGVLYVALSWQSLEPVEEDYITVVKLVNGVYHVWGESQSRLWGDEFWAGRWAEGLVIGDSHRIELLPATPPGLYQLEVNIVNPRSGQTLEADGGLEMLSEPLEIPRRSPSVEALDVGHPLGADLGGKIRLLGYNIESGFQPGDNIHLTLFWQCLQEMEQSYTVFIHLVDAGDNTIAQKDNPPVDGFYSTIKWEMGEIVRDQYDLVIPPNVSSGEYQPKVGIYLAETGERLNVLEDGIPLSDNQIPLQPVAIGSAK